MAVTKQKNGKKWKKMGMLAVLIDKHVKIKRKKIAMVSKPASFKKLVMFANSIEEHRYLYQ